VFGGRTVVSPSGVNQGDPASEVVAVQEVRASIVAGKRRNGRGAKGGRKVMREGKASGGTTLGSAERIG
jgi:hypothetical protein